MDKGKKPNAATAVLRKYGAGGLTTKTSEAVDAHILAERKRCAGLMALGQQAARLGVSFDVDAAIRSRVSLKAARDKVMFAAADGDAPETSPIFMGSAAGRNGDAGAAKVVDKAAMWRKAYESNRPKPVNRP